MHSLPLSSPPPTAEIWLWSQGQTNLNALSKLLASHTHAAVPVQAVEEVHQTQVVLLDVVLQFDHGMHPRLGPLGGAVTARAQAQVGDFFPHPLEHVTKVCVDHNVLYSTIAKHAIGKHVNSNGEYKSSVNMQTAMESISNL